MRKTVDILLTTDVPTLGSSGEIKTVSFSYAKHFLFPRNLAVAADANTLRHQEAQQKHAALETSARDAHAARLAQQLAAVVIQIVSPANDKGVLYGGIHAVDICSRISAAGIRGVTPKMVQLRSPIRTTGNHKVVVQLAPKKATELHVQIRGNQKTDSSPRKARRST